MPTNPGTSQAPGPMGQLPQSTLATQGAQAQNIASTYLPRVGTPNAVASPNNPNQTLSLGAPGSSDASNNAIIGLLQSYLGANQTGVNYANAALGQQQTVGAAQQQVTDQNLQQQYSDILQQLGMTGAGTPTFAPGSSTQGAESAAAGSGTTSGLTGVLNQLGLSRTQAGQQYTTGTQSAANTQAALVNQIQQQKIQNYLQSIQNVPEFSSLLQAAPYTGGYLSNVTNQMLSGLGGG